MARDLSAEPLLDVDVVQGDILVGLIKKVEHLLFFRIDDVDAFKTFAKVMDVTSMKDCLDQQTLIQTRKAAGLQALVPTPGLNIAFTAKGLTVLKVGGIDTASLDPAFKAGMANRTSEIKDPDAKTWKVLKPDVVVHGVFIVTGASAAEIANLVSSRLAPIPGNGWTLVHEEVGVVRPEPVKGHEHFGFADGVSQPGVRGLILPGVPLTPGTSTDENQGNPGQDLLWPGEFIFGQPGQVFKTGQKFFVKGDPVAAPIPFMENGAYLVFRRLAQKVPEFNAAVECCRVDDHRVGGSRVDRPPRRPVGRAVEKRRADDHRTDGRQSDVRRRHAAHQRFRVWRRSRREVVPLGRPHPQGLPPQRRSCEGRSER